MIYILLLLSFIIHIVTFIIVRQLKLKIDSYQNMEENIEEKTKSIEDTLAVYLVEIRQENDELIKRLEKASMGNTHDLATTKQKTEGKPAPAVAPKSQESTYQPITPIDKAEDKVEQSITAKALHLQAKGYNTEAIAKELNKGKTEVELLLKFQQKNH